MPVTYTPTAPTSFPSTISEPSTSDPVLGGVGGAANSGVEDNADNAQWLYNQRFIDAKFKIEAASGGRATLLEDDNGNWNVMARIGKFKPSTLDSDLGSDGNYHPAFYVNGTLKDFIYVGLYQCSDDGDGNLVSHAHGVPELATFSTHHSSCGALGTGWHMMTVQEYGALALLGINTGAKTSGNRALGFGEYGGQGELLSSSTDNTYAGSGPMSWRHDGNPFGVADLIGNYSEFVNCFKTINNLWYVTNDNYYDLAEGSWPATDIYYQDAAASLSMKNTGTTSAGTFAVNWDGIDIVGTVPSKLSTSYMCDIMLSRVWDDGTTYTPTLLSGVAGRRSVDLSLSTAYATIGGTAGVSTISHFGLGYNFSVNSSTTAACRLAYIP